MTRRNYALNNLENQSMNNRFLPPWVSPRRDEQAGAGDANPSNVPKIHDVYFFFTGITGYSHGRWNENHWKTKLRAHPGGKPTPLTSCEVFLIEHGLPTPRDTLSATNHALFSSPDILRTLFREQKIKHNSHISNTRSLFRFQTLVTGWYHEHKNSGPIRCLAQIHVFHLWMT